MAKEVQRIELTDTIELVLGDGSVVKVRPGPYGKGISVIPVPPAPPKRGGVPRKPGGGGPRGRKPRPSTVKLRERLAKDAAKGNVDKAPVYVKWVLSIDPDISLATARQVVYRERRAALEAAEAGDLES